MRSRIGQFAVGLTCLILVGSCGSSETDRIAELERQVAELERQATTTTSIATPVTTISITTSSTLSADEFAAFLQCVEDAIAQTEDSASSEIRFLNEDIASEHDTLEFFEQYIEDQTDELRERFDEARSELELLASAYAEGSLERLTAELALADLELLWTEGERERAKNLLEFRAEIALSIDALNSAIADVERARDQGISELRAASDAANHGVLEWTICS